ncbi:MAG TPA: ferredoxin family protein [Candidatus Bathyarchaeota archaeon]|nr:ferredoxin family protein [Candidatus Bathyarchaeota archaeon]
MRLPRKPLRPRKALRIREVEVLVIWDRCKGCGFCIEFCPRGVLDYSDKLNARGARPPVVVRPEECVGCGLCQDICPDLAIFVVPVKSEEGR